MEGTSNSAMLKDKVLLETMTESQGGADGGAFKPYTPQFTKTSQLIISRMEARQGISSWPTLSNTNEVASETDQKSKIAVTKNLGVFETLRMPVHASASASIGDGFLAGAWRKRKASPGSSPGIGGSPRKRPFSGGDSSSISSGGSNSHHALTSTGRRNHQQTAKSRAERSRCPRCRRIISMPGNSLVACVSCSQAWHQKCHDPPIPQSACLLPSRTFQCRDCAAAREEPAPLRLDGCLFLPWRERDDGLRPDGAVSRLVGFAGGDASDYEV